MSLKARLRVAVALLMSAMVVVLSGLYIRGFLLVAFHDAHDDADSLANELQSAILEELNIKSAANAASPSPETDARQFWQRTVEADPVIHGFLDRAFHHWHLASEVFMSDDSGRILASSSQERSGSQEVLAPNLAEWKKRSLIANIRQVFVERQDAEIRRPIGFSGQKTPLLNIHIVVSSIFLRNQLETGLQSVGYVFAACLVVSIILALMLPNFILNPLERLGRNIDLMASGKFDPGSRPPEREAKEFADVYSKLNLLGQQFMGAQENVDQLRGNVEQVLERLEEAVLLFDSNGRLTMAGTAVRRLLGREPGELVGQALPDIFPESSDIGALASVAIRENEPVRDRIVSVSRGERDCSLLVGILPLGRADSGQRMGTMITLRDADTRDELAAQLDLASRLTALSQLSHGVAHEIKNPLNAIILHLEVLRSRLEEEMPEVGVISREISRLDRVVKTFLDFNRPVQPHLRVMDLNELARDIGRLIAPDTQSRGVQVEVRTAPRAVFLNGDPDLLKQAFLNVVMNGLEAMNSGGDLIIETRRAGGRSEIAVTDTGPGIPLEIQSKIFNLYFTTKAQGSGIGLAMTFRFVQLHDGRIDFLSEAGRGTTFVFSFPEAASPTQADLELSRSQKA